MQDKYIKQVALLVKCLPIIATEKCFAIKGGTAINLFYLNLPRLSVDIDLVYLPIEDRTATYQNIHRALERISLRLSKLGLTVQSNQKAEEKLVCSDGFSDIKIVFELRGQLTDEDRKLLLDFVELKTDLKNLSIPFLNLLPGIEWKKKNLEKLRNSNPRKFQEQAVKLKEILS